MSSLTKPSSLTGTTSDRPIGLSDGFMFFDVTLGHPIWSLDTSVSGWVNSVGADV